MACTQYEDSKLMYIPIQTSVLITW